MARERECEKLIESYKARPSSYSFTFVLSIFYACANACVFYPLSMCCVYFQPTKVTFVQRAQAHIVLFSSSVFLIYCKSPRDIIYFCCIWYFCPQCRRPEPNTHINKCVNISLSCLFIRNTINNWFSFENCILYCAVCRPC